MNTAGKIWLAAGIFVFLAGGAAIALYMSKPKKKINCSSKFLFIGDSNTVITSSYSKQLQKLCPGMNVKVLAETSRNTSTMLQSMRDDLKAGNKYDVIAILGGSNDLGTNIDTISNLTDMYELGKSNGAIVIAITPPSKNFIRLAQPTWGGNNYPQLLQKLKNIVDWQLKNNISDIVINWNKLTDRKDYFNSDMQHANATAHAVLLKQIIEKVPIHIV